MKTNEELVRLIQEGKSEYKEQLWTQCLDFVKYMANKHLLGYPDHYQWLFDDMVNQAYLHFDAAVQKHDNSRGKFLTYYEFYIKNAFAEVLYNRTEKQKHDPLNTSVSLDTPLNDTDDLILLETLVDTQSEAYFETIEDNDFWKSVKQLINKAIKYTVPSDYSEFFRIMLIQGMRVKEALRVLEIDVEQYSKYQNAFQRGIRSIRNYIVKEARKNRKCNPVLDEMISYHTGYYNWQNNMCSSSVELEVIRRNDRKITAAALVEMQQDMLDRSKL